MRKHSSHVEKEKFALLDSVVAANASDFVLGFTIL